MGRGGRIDRAAIQTFFFSRRPLLPWRRRELSLPVRMPCKHGRKGGEGPDESGDLRFSKFFPRRYFFQPQHFKKLTSPLLPSTFHTRWQNPGFYPVIACIKGRVDILLLPGLPCFPAPLSTGSNSNVWVQAQVFCIRSLPPGKYLSLVAPLESWKIIIALPPLAANLPK